jgi:hypothetical protein
MIEKVTLGYLLGPCDPRLLKLHAVEIDRLASVVRDARCLFAADHYVADDSTPTNARHLTITLSGTIALAMQNAMSAHMLVGAHTFWLFCYLIRSCAPTMHPTTSGCLRAFQEVMRRRWDSMHPCLSLVLAVGSLVHLMQTAVIHCMHVISCVC